MRVKNRGSHIEVAVGHNNAGWFFIICIIMPLCFTSRGLTFITAMSNKMIKNKVALSNDSDLFIYDKLLLKSFLPSKMIALVVLNNEVYLWNNSMYLLLQKDSF